MTIDDADIQPRSRPRLLPLLALAVVASAALYLVLYGVSLRLPYVLLLAVGVGLALLRWAVGLVAAPLSPSARDVVRPVHVSRRLEPGDWYEGGDGVAEAVRRWDRRLGWGELDGQRWGRAVGRHLGELVDERLRQRYGITRATHPDRARALVGERLWVLLGEVDRAPTARQVNAALADLERMPDALDATTERKDPR